MTAAALNNLAFNLKDMGRYDEAARYYREALDVRRRLLGDEHIETAATAQNLAMIYRHQERYAEAEPLLRQSLAAMEKAAGPKHPLTAGRLHALGGVLYYMGRFSEAEPLLRRAVAIRREVIGPNDPTTMISVNLLALVLRGQARDAEAEPLFREVVEAHRQIYGENHLYTATARENLGMSVLGQERYAEAEQLFRLAVTDTRKARGDVHVETAHVLVHLGNALDPQRKFVEAEACYREALAIYEKLAPRAEGDRAWCMDALGTCLCRQGRSQDGLPMLKEAAALARRSLGAGHINTVMFGDHLLQALILLGRHEEAEELGEELARAFESSRLRVSDAGLARAGAMNRESPLLLLPVCKALRGDGTGAYQRLEQGLARGLLEEFVADRLGQLSQEERQRLQELRAKLQDNERRTAELQARREPTDKEQLELAAAFKQRQELQDGLESLLVEQSLKEVLTLERIQEGLPERAALVAWLDVEPPHGGSGGGEHHAVIVRKTGTPIWVRLPGTGPQQEWTVEDIGLAARLRAELSDPKRDRTARPRELIGKLYSQRLAPLEPHLHEVKHLIVLPSARLAGLPVEVLTDRWTVSYAPSGTMLARLRRGAPRGEPKSGRTLLAVGDPAFSPTASPKDAALPALPGTRYEVEAIAPLFERSELLLGERASKEELRKLAPDMKRFDVLHLATHGLINPRQALASSIALSGSPEDVGRLTALEMRKDWRLDADLVVLSACSSGLGQWTTGEGYLGFSQVLLSAGARSLIVSQWPVSDAATSLLMVRFYENWLGARKEPGARQLTKAEALREAKNWLRNLSRQEVEARLAKLPETARGLKLEAAGTPPRADAPEKPFADPYYWSAFILIGDPD
jgi:CHAT domain-containing protein/Flp pilus assembly protein TadD